MSARSGIRAVTFDVGGTLIEPWPSVGHVYAEVAAQHGWPDLSPERLNGQFVAAWRANEPFDHRRDGWARLVDLTFAGLCDPPPSGTFFPALYERFAQSDAWRIFDDVLPALEALRERGVRLGLISNWDERLRLLLERLQLANHFEVIVISCETGAIKPDARIFHEAASRLSLSPETILHVGDSLEADVNGARTAGFQALLLARHQSLRKEGQIPSLLEVHSRIADSRFR